MKTNFDITHSNEICIEGRHIDLHNNFDFVSLDYNVTLRQVKLTWNKSKGDWVDENEIAGLVLVHEIVTYFTVGGQDDESTFDNARCLSDISFFPSNDRDANNLITLQAKPNEDDDILYLFMNGQFIRINCARIVATIMPGI